MRSEERPQGLRGHRAHVQARRRGSGSIAGTMATRQAICELDNTSRVDDGGRSAATAESRGEGRGQAQGRERPITVHLRRRQWVQIRSRQAAQKKRMGLDGDARTQPGHAGLKTGTAPRRNATQRQSRDVRDDRRHCTLNGRCELLDGLRHTLPR
eukprot:3647148-Pyramimonas_sp.AAC.1